MRIAHLHWGFPPIIGGVETHLTILLPELVKQGHAVGLLTGTSDNSKSRYKFGGADIFRSPLFDLNWLYKRGIDALEKEISATYEEFFGCVKPDIIHAHNMHYFSASHACLLDSIAKKLNVPLVLTAHNVWDDLQFLKLTTNIDWTHIIAVSHYIKKEMTGIGVPEHKVTVIHHGVDVKKFNVDPNQKDILKKHPKLKNRKIVFHPARMGLAKGCDVSIKAINLVKERIPDVILVLAGTKNIIDWGVTQQKDIAYLVDLIKIFGLEDYTYVNYFDLDEMPALYNCSQACIYPSSSQEPFGLTMLESMASAKPIVVTNAGGMPEVVQEDINGYIVKIKDFDSLATRVAQILSDTVLRNRLGRTGKQIVSTHFTKEIMANSHLRLYEDLISKKRS
ncbi:MAG: glycosyltransferase family 4 protein [Endomicrobiales bacterium]|nr:glycosyltransferase family 4 protein [Endomicrobiales bacterium]